MKRSAVSVALASMLVVSTAACGSGGADVTAAEDRLAEAEAGADSEALFTDPEQLLDQEVEVTGVVGELVGDNGALLSNAEMGGEQVLVVASSADAAELRSEAVVNVAGMLQSLDPAAVAEAIGEELDPELLSSYEGDPVIVAETISPAAEDATEQ